MVPKNSTRDSEMRISLLREKRKKKTWIEAKIPANTGGIPAFPNGDPNQRVSQTLCGPRDVIYGIKKRGMRAASAMQAGTVYSNTTHG